VFNSLRSTTVSGCPSASLSRSALATLARISAIVILSGILSAAVAQTRPVEQTGSDAGAAGQNQASAADQTQVIPVADPGQTQGLVHIVPFGRGTSGLKNTFAPGGAHLTYWGGPVISNVQVVVVFWGPNVNSVVTANGTIDQFYTDITNSRFFDLLTEYTTAGVTGAPPANASSNQTIGHGAFGGKFTITPSLCPGPAACTITDAQIQTELTNQINAAVLPAPQTDVHGIINTYYVIYFPPNVKITAGSSSCVQGGFCAYHSNTGSLVPYGVMPDFSTGGCSLGCGGGTLFQNITAVSSHEMSEAVTDAQVGSASVFGPPLAWYHHNPPAADLGEIGDICGGQDVAVSAGNNTYTIQQEFSNLQNDCVAAPPVMHMPASGAGPNVPFNLTLTVQSSTTAATLSSYTGMVHFTSSDPLAVLPADYTFVAGDAGSHTFQFTLNTLGNQTISVVDTRAGGFTGSTTINVSAATDLATSVSPSQLAAAQGATGLTVATSVHNNGGTASTGVVSVTTTLGSGLNATAIAGTGWTCTLASLTCTRTDALASGLSYPDITVTFNVAPNAPSSASISSTVSGGGDADLANNTANATVTIGPVVSIISSTASASIIAGASAQYVVGMGLGPTAGTVTFSCSGLPTASSCSFSPASLTSSGNVTMTVSTTARGAVVSLPGPSNRTPLIFLALLSLAALACLRLRGQPRPVRRLASVLGTAVLVVAALAGCGGGGSPPPPPPVVGTPVGSFTITFLATSPNGTATQAMNLTVR